MSQSPLFDVFCQRQSIIIGNGESCNYENFFRWCFKEGSFAERVRTATIWHVEIGICALTPRIQKSISPITISKTVPKRGEYVVTFWDPVPTYAIVEMKDILLFQFGELYEIVFGGMYELHQSIVGADLFLRIGVSRSRLLGWLGRSIGNYVDFGHTRNVTSGAFGQRNFNSPAVSVQSSFSNSDTKVQRIQMLLVKRSSHIQVLPFNGATQILI